LRGAATASAIGVAVGAGLLSPARLLAAEIWPTKAFDAQNVDDAMNALFKTSDAIASDAISIKAPDIAENGAVVPITIETDLDKVESISIIAERNPSPLSARFELGPGTRPFVSTRIKMGETSNVVALVQADGKLYSASKEVKVTIGGCGG
jgi:sulfur-oxidizing protein SoxY